MNYSKYLPWITGLVVFIVYLLTIAPSVIQIDSGELAAVQIMAGIAHPTGYPLFTIMGFLWAKIPMPFSPIFQMNLLAALLCSIGVVLFIKSSLLILNKADKFRTFQRVKTKSRGKKKQEIKAADKPAVYSEMYIIASIISAALILAFSRTFWFQSTSVEVYSLHIVLILLIIYNLLSAYINGGEKITDKNWLIFSAVLALGFTNHMTTLLILPGTAYLYFNKYGFNGQSFKRLAVMILLFLIILIPVYSYLPLRASADPVLNWGNPVDLERILRHISGQQYQVWLFSSTESAKKQLEYFITNLPSEFSLSLLLCIAGIFFSAGYIKKIFVFLLICFVSTVLYSINYEIADIDSYFLLAYISLSFFAVFAVLKALDYFYRNGKGYKTIISAAGIFIALQIYVIYRDVDQSGNYVFEDYTKSILESVSEDAIIFSYQWDYFISASYYYQFVEGLRRDAVIIDKELLRRSWYYKQIETSHPEVLSGVETDINLFLNALKPFEREEQYNAALLETLFRRIMTGLVSTNLEERDFYIGREIVEGEMQRGEFSLPAGYTLVPDLLMFKVVKDNKEYIPAGDPDFSLRFPSNDNHYSRMIKNFTGNMLAARALYEMQFDKRDRAKVYIDKIKNDIPGFTMPAGLAQVFN